MKNYIKHITLIALSFALYACSPAQQGTVPHFKVGGPYRIDGKMYKPKIEPSYTEEGMASWYGDKFHMRKTANGEVFHKGDLTAAHRTLPLPSIVRVTNTANGKSVILRVNDRGPFAKSRIIDVSEKAAKMLDFKLKGTALVKVELLQKESAAALGTVKIKPDEKLEMQSQYDLALKKKTFTSVSPYANKQVTKATGKPYKATTGIEIPGARIVAGTYSNHKIALAQKATLKKNFSTKIEQIKVDGSSPYRLIIGGIKTPDEAKSVIAKLKSLGYKNARLE
jgi:rare lipoprotein A